MVETPPSAETTAPGPVADQAEGRACGQAGAQSGAEAGTMSPRAERRLQTLEDLAEVGMALARSLLRRAELAEAGEASADEPVGAAEAALAFSRLSRAVRQTLALEARLEDELRADQAQAAARAAERRAAEDERRARRKLCLLIRKSTVQDIVEEVIEANAREAGGREADGPEVERLFDGLYERLEDDAEDDDFENLPIGELVQRICLDLGVAFDPALWADEDWALDEWSGNGEPSSPFTGLARPPGWPAARARTAASGGMMTGRPP
ncbi:MAG: hypothetical protein P4L73_19960 [Caulobacteraceae bacterium]|nr:hypothetical protein [Caulobacteraceae bacterium]